jgi:predicted DNA binding CopG/RHH family protein
MPPFKTMAEEREYWDNTDLGAEFARPDTVMVSPKAAAMSVRFDAADVAAIKQEAQHRGVGPSTLVRMVMREHLRASHR